MGYLKQHDSFDWFSNIGMSTSPEPTHSFCVLLTASLSGRPLWGGGGDRVKEHETVEWKLCVSYAYEMDILTFKLLMCIRPVSW